MNLTEAKSLYVDHIVKDQGYKDNEDIQLIFRSELNKGKRIVCLIKGEPYLLPESIAEALRSHHGKSNKGLPEGLTFYTVKEWYRVPFAYFIPYTPMDIKTANLTAPISAPLQPVTLTDVPVEEVVEERSPEAKLLYRAAFTFGQMKSIDPIVLQEFAKLSGCKDVKALIASNIEIAYGNFINEPSDEVLSSLITNLLLYNYNK